jgi:translocation and assembly module TamB
LTGPLEHLIIDGDMLLTDGRVNRTFDFLSLLRGSDTPKTNLPMQLFSFTDPPLNTASLKIRLRSEKSVDISNNVTSGSIRPDIILGGTGEQPVITGNIFLDPTRLRLPSGTLYMEGGLVHFSEINPDLPQLDLSGMARIMGYDITVHVSGTIPEPIITLSSSPPLPNDELLLLLLTGKPPQSEANMETLRKGSMNIAVYLGKDMLRQWFSSGEAGKSDESILERFELEIGRGVTRLGEETVEAQFRLAENVFRDNDVLFLTAEKDIYDAINSGIKIEFRFK